MCGDVICGGALGVVRGIFDVSLFTASETEEIMNYKPLALSVMEKAPEIITKPIIYETIKEGQKLGLEIFAKSASPEVVTDGIFAAAEVVCIKAFSTRFRKVLLGACLDLTGC